MKWTLNTYVTAQDWALPELTEICQKTGYPYVEILQDYNQAHGLEADTAPAAYRRARHILAEAGIRTGSLTSCVAFHQLDKDAYRAAVEKASAVIDRAVLLEADHVRVLGDRFPDWSPQVRQQILGQVGEALGELGAYAADKGITVSLEMHGHFTDPEFALDVVSRANRSNVGLVFNCQWRTGAERGWSLPEGASSIEPLYQLVGEHFTSIHTHRMEAPAERAYYRELFQLLRRDGYQGYVSNECAYNGAEPEKVLTLYTALFESLSGGSAAQ